MRLVAMPSRDWMVKLCVMALSTRDEVRLEFLRQAKPGSWLAVSEDGYELFGEGNTPEEALEQAKRNGHEDAVLTMVPPEWRPRIL